MAPQGSGHHWGVVEKQKPACLWSLTTLGHTLVRNEASSAKFAAPNRSNRCSSVLCAIVTSDAVKNFTMASLL